MDAEQEQSKVEKIADLRRDIAAKKACLIDAPGNKLKNAFSLRGKSTGSRKNQFQKGRVPSEEEKEKRDKSRRPKFWVHIVKILDMSKDDAQSLLDDDSVYLSMAEEGAIRFCQKVANGVWVQQQEVIQREMGRNKEFEDNDDDGNIPRVITMPFKMLRTEDENLAAEKENGVA